MSMLIGQAAPTFKATAVMPDDSMQEIALNDFKGRKYVLLFFYPLDFTFVCPTEIIAFNNRILQFESLDTKVLGVSIDSQYTHLAWKTTPINKGGIGPIQFPLLADVNRSISQSFGVLNSEGVAFRATFIIDKQGIIKHQAVNDLPVGRNVEEFLRTIEAIQHHETSGNVCPAGWNNNKDSFVASHDGIVDYLTANAESL